MSEKMVALPIVKVTNCLFKKNLKTNVHIYIKIKQIEAKINFNVTVFSFFSAS